MKIRKAFYCFKQGIVNLYRNKLYTIASICTIAACLFLIGLFYTVVINFQHIVTNIEENIGITVFFNEGTEQTRIDEIGAQIKGMEGVKEIVFTSADEAWASFQESYFADSPELADGFKDDNPLASSANYTVFIQDIGRQKEYVENIKAIPDVRKVNYSENTVSTMTTFGRLVGYVSAAIIFILLCVGVFLISNTVMMGISVRKREITIMKLIGATNLFVRSPFVIEGVIIGIVGASIPLGILWAVYGKVVAFVVKQFSALSSLMNFLPAKTIFATLVPLCFIIGAGIGFLGSFLSIRKHLKI